MCGLLSIYLDSEVLLRRLTNVASSFPLPDQKVSIAMQLTFKVGILCIQISIEIKQVNFSNFFILQNSEDGGTRFQPGMSGDPDMPPCELN